MLPWSDDLFRISVFNLAPGTDTITPALNNAVRNTLNAAKAEDLKEDGKEMRTLLDKGKDEAAKNFSAVLNDWRSEGELPQEEHRAIFARSIGRRAGVDESTVNIDFVVNSLNALCIFENQRIKVAAKSRDYYVDKHSNDIYDAGLLIYLADPTLHLLTSDKGLRRVEKSSQHGRVHIADADCLKNAQCATDLIRQIVQAADPVT